LSLADFLKVVKLEPKHPDGYYNSAVAYFQLGNYDKAWKYYHKAVKRKAQVHPNFVTELQNASGRKR
jgi:pentatricopeptide repeat protein